MYKVILVVEAARKCRCDPFIVAASDHNALVRLLVGSAIPGLIGLLTIPVLVEGQAGRASWFRPVALVSSKLRPIFYAAEMPVRAWRHSYFSFSAA